MLNRKEKKELRERIVEMALSDDESRPAWVTTWIQKKPYTAAAIAATLPLDSDDGHVFTAAGFSKVCYPDKWNARYGVELAVKRAAADIVRQWDAFLDLELTNLGLNEG